MYSGGQFAVFLDAGHDFKQVIYNSKGDVCIAHLDIRWKPSALYSNAPVQKSVLEHVNDVLCSSQLVCGFRLLHGLS